MLMNDDECIYLKVVVKNVYLCFVEGWMMNIEGGKEEGYL